MQTETSRGMFLLLQASLLLSIPSHSLKRITPAVYTIDSIKLSLIGNCNVHEGKHGDKIDST